MNTDLHGWRSDGFEEDGIKVFDGEVLNHSVAVAFGADALAITIPLGIGIAGVNVHVRDVSRYTCGNGQGFALAAFGTSHVL